MEKNWSCSTCQKRFDPNITFSDLLDYFTSEEFYRSVDQPLESSAAVEAKNIGSAICGLCLGILDANVCRKVVETVKLKFLDQHYDVVDFNPCISYPISTIIRERLIEIYLCKENQMGSISLKLLKDVAKICYKALLERALNMHSSAQSDFNINVNFTNSIDETDAENMGKIFREELKSKNNAHRKQKKKMRKLGIVEVSRADLASVLPKLSEGTANEFGLDLPPKYVNSACIFDVGFERQPLYIGGRYNKFSRFVNQTPWMIDGVKKSKDSVQELIASKFADAIICDEVKFTASGREDADVRMLGEGRPFALQFINPRRTNFSVEEVDLFAKCINRSSVDVQVQRLCVLSDRDFEMLKQGEEMKTKQYVALCYSPQVIGEETIGKIAELRSKQLELTQKTPIRVLHRRPLADRKRTVSGLSAMYVDDHHFQLFLVTQAGTYVKEFVHGDFGRTQPSLSDLLQIDVDILELDVENIDFAWPPQKTVNTSS